MKQGSRQGPEHVVLPIFGQPFVLQSPKIISSGSNCPRGIAPWVPACSMQCPSSLKETQKLSGLRFLNQLCMLVLSMGSPGASMSQAANWLLPCTVAGPRQAQQEEKGFSNCQTPRNPSLPLQCCTLFFFLKMKVLRHSPLDSLGPGPEGSTAAAEHQDLSPWQGVCAGMCGLA